MTKALAFISYGLNAGLMLGVALFLAKSLSPFEYSRYSFAVATAQTLGVVVSEWVRLAATRNYPGPDPEIASGLRTAFLGGQYLLGICALLLASVVALATVNSYWLLIALYTVLLGVVDLQFIMLRCDSQLALFSRLQIFKGIASLVLITWAAFLFGHGNAALLAAIVANILTIASLGIVRPEFVLATPSFQHLQVLGRVASYGISAATAGGLHQAGPLFLRCAAFRGTSESSYAAFSLVMDLMQRPYDLILNAAHGVFFPDVVREHDKSPNSDNAALRLLYAIDAWCLLIVLGCTMAFRMELMPLLIKAELLPYVLEVFPYLSAFFLLHCAINYTCALTLHLTFSRILIITQAALELVWIVGMTVMGFVLFGSGIHCVAGGGLLGVIFGFLTASRTCRTVRCRLPWASWIAALLTALPLVVIGQTASHNSLTGIALCSNKN